MSYLNSATIKMLIKGDNKTILHVQKEDEQDILFSWGENTYGQLGLGHENNVNTPQPLDMNFLNGAKISNLAYGVHSPTILHARGADGQDILFSWGRNSVGELGLGHDRRVCTPERITSGPFKPIVQQFALGRTRRTLKRIEQEMVSESTLLRRGLVMGLGSALSYLVLPQTIPYQLIGSHVSSGILSHLISRHKINQVAQIKQAHTDYHDNSIDKQSTHYQQGKRSATSHCSYLLSYFKTCGQKANKEWRAGFAEGLLEDDIRKQRQKFKQQFK